MRDRNTSRCDHMLSVTGTPWPAIALSSVWRAMRRPCASCHAFADAGLAIVNMPRARSRNEANDPARTLFGLPDMVARPAA